MTLEYAKHLIRESTQITKPIFARIERCVFFIVGCEMYFVFSHGQALGKLNRNPIYYTFMYLYTISYKQCDFSVIWTMR